MKKGEKIINLSKKIVEQLKPYCKKISIAGSIRRKSPSPGDIDIVLIPKNREKLEDYMKIKGRFIQGGKQESTWKTQGIKLELYYTNDFEFGATLLAYSSKKGSEIGLRVVAKNKGFLLNSHGLFDRKTGKRIAGKTEREIYKALNRPYKEPWNR